MAVLGTGDYRWLKKKMLSTYKVELRSMGIDRLQFRLAFQAIEDYMVGAYTTRPASSLRDVLDPITGGLTVAQDSALFFAWAAWKAYSME